MFFIEYLDSLYISASLIITYTFFNGYLFRSYTPDEMKTWKPLLLLGSLGGCLNIFILMYAYSASNNTTLLDLRVLVLVSVFFVSGFRSAIITAVITILFRLLYFGITPSAIIGSCGIVFLLLCFAIITLTEKKKPFDLNTKWFICVGLSLLTNIVVYTLALSNLVINPWPIISQYTLWLLIASVIQFNIITYITSSNEIYTRYVTTSNIDHLTQLYNARYFDSIYQETVVSATKYKTPFSVMMIDIDHFKSINDTYGHDEGDLVLQKVATLFHQSFRKEDTVGRIGGEEFCIILTNCSLSASKRIGEHFRELVEHTPFILSNGKGIQVHVSIGVANFSESTDDITALKKLADDALYEAKNTGRNKICAI